MRRAAVRQPSAGTRSEPGRQADAMARVARAGHPPRRADAAQAARHGRGNLSLALALGASVAAFSLVDALILRPLPVREPRADWST